MAVTKLADVIVPEVFTPYVVQRTMELSALVQSGIIANNAQFDGFASQSATTINMPYWGDLSGDSENIVEDATLTAGSIAASQDIATIFRRARMWGSTDLSAALSGDKPVDIIANLVAAYWARDLQKELLAVLAGVFGAASMSGNVLDISGGVGAAAVWSAEAFIDAVQLLGDAKENLSGILMHSATETLLEKQNLIATTAPSDGGAPIKTYQGKRVIVDDTCPVSSGTYTTYIFGQGAIALGNGSPVGFVATEVDRDKRMGSGVDYLINRRTNILHPRGVKWAGASVADATSPTRAELGTAANWVRVFENKAIRLVAFKHKLVSA